MDVFFETQKTKPFSIELGYFDTILEIKEKIQKYQSIPITKQTLVFNGQVLQDERDIEHCGILNNSHIQLVITPDNTDNSKTHQKIKTEESPTKKIQINVKIPSSNVHVPIEMELNDNVLRLKEKIQEMESVAANRLILQFNNGELSDNRTLKEYELLDNSEVNVIIKPSPAGSGTGSGGAATGAGTRKMKLLVLSKCGKKIPVEMNPSDNVGELRKEVQKLHQRLHFHLPQEGYFFIYKQNVMDDDRSFRWHHVNQGDTIEIFNGSVTGGS
ncbi:ubiquitin-like protein-NEDD8-like protein RUB3 [Mercurialis annua]|uniref:ubiquitin-like protein-NEDD8-like protein RUB3 n=1 Tax=Mercurialis annua TaxID=3986 RepID=UPI00215E0D34|nr:ubiquitin-like protein-NEDD8-like protein RUB3 [Mercurialis annua]